MGFFQAMLRCKFFTCFVKTLRGFERDRNDKSSGLIKMFWFYYSDREGFKKDVCLLSLCLDAVQNDVRTYGDILYPITI